MRKVVVLLLSFCFLMSSCISNEARVESPKDNSKQFVSYLKDRVVRVEVEYMCDGIIRKSGGTGVIIRSNKYQSYILTAEHVVSEPSCSLHKVWLGRVDWNSNYIERPQAFLVKKDANKDIALLKVYKNMGVNSEIASNYYLGQKVFSTGFPVELSSKKIRHLRFSEGVLSVASISLYNEDYLQFTAQIYYGNSGGPIWTSNGELLGITTLFYRDWTAAYPTYYGPSAKTIKMFLSTLPL